MIKLNYNIQNNNKIKIISGYLGGQIIKIFNHQHLKPTMHRIRETLFNWIQNKIYYSNCLDCFAGSGSLGIESISRHAHYVTLIEKNHKIVYFLKKNINRLKIKNINIINTNTISWLKKQKNKYDIIFLDPPYYDNLLQKSIYYIHKNHLIQKNGYIYIETPKNNKNIQYPNNWYIYKKKNTKHIQYTLYTYIN